MNRRHRTWARLALAGLCMVLAPLAVASDEGHAAADQVDAQSYDEFLDLWLYTHGGDNRGPNGPDHDPARDNILAFFQSYGLQAQLEPFVWNNREGENVVAVMPGTLYPNQVFIIGAHYDSVSNPGCDDNASGVALVLEAARILSQYDSDYTIKFMAFDLEELGLYGSRAYVQQHPGEDVRGMISADMVAYDTNTNRCSIYGRTASNPIKSALAAAVDEYGDGLLSSVGGDMPYSDHAPFEAAGYQACNIIESEVFNNPHYHTPTDSYDTPGYIKIPFAVKITRSVVGWLVDQAQVAVTIDRLGFEYPQGLPQYSRPDGQTSVQVRVFGVGGALPKPGTGRLHYDLGRGWESVAMTEIEPDLYEVKLPAQTCSEPVRYYFSAQDLSDEIWSDPRRAPAESHLAVAAYGELVAFENYLDADPGWVTEGDWAFGQPTGQGGSHGGPDPTGGHTGAFVYGYNLFGDYANNMPERHVTTGSIDCTGTYGVELSFWRWLGVERSFYDHACVGVSTDGTHWTKVWENPDEETADAEWQQMVFDVSDLVDNQPTVYLRWTMGTTDVGWTYCGWNIDDVRLKALACEPLLKRGDLNCDDEVGFGDINPFILALSDPAGYKLAFPDCDITTGDINEDGKVDFGDINPFVALLTGP